MKSIQAFGVLVLVLAGLGGFLYNLFRSDGWVEKSLGNALSYLMESPLVFLSLIVAAVCLGLWWRHDRVSLGRNRKAPTYVLYAVMAAGAYFIGKLALFQSL